MANAILTAVANTISTGQSKAVQKAGNKQIKDYKKVNKQTNKEIKNAYNGANSELDSNFNAWADAYRGVVDNSINRLTDTTDKQIEATRQQYQKAYDYNALNERIQQDNLQERMTDLGMAKSGYNATNQTALGVARINADNATYQSYNNAVNTLRSNLQEKVFQLEQEFGTNYANRGYEVANNKTNNTLQGNLAISQNNRDIGLKTADIKYNTATAVAQLDADEKKGANTAYETLIGGITSSDPSTACSYILAGSQRYGISEDTLLRMSGISKTDYNAWKKDHNYFANKQAEKNAQINYTYSKNSGGRSGNTIKSKSGAISYAYQLATSGASASDIANHLKKYGVSWDEWKKSKNYVEVKGLEKLMSNSNNNKPDKKDNNGGFKNAQKTVSLHFRGYAGDKIKGKDLSDYLEGVQKTYKLSEDEVNKLIKQVRQTYVVV